MQTLTVLPASADTIASFIRLGTGVWPRSTALQRGPREDSGEQVRTFRDVCASKRVTYSRRYFKRPDKQARRHNQLARKIKQEGPEVLGNCFDSTHPLYPKAKRIYVSQWEVERWNDHRDRRLGRWPWAIERYTISELYG